MEKRRKHMSDHNHEPNKFVKGFKKTADEIKKTRTLVIGTGIIALSLFLENSFDIHHTAIKSIEMLSYFTTTLSAVCGIGGRFIQWSIDSLRKDCELSPTGDVTFLKNGETKKPPLKRLGAIMFPKAP